MKFNTKPQKTQRSSRLSARLGNLAKRRDDLFYELVSGLLYSFTAFLLGACTLPFGASPFGVAYLCASNKKLPYILAGLVFSAFLSSFPAITLAAYLVVLLVRILTRLTIDTPWEERSDSGEIELSEFIPTLFGESLYLRMATSSVGVFCISLYTLINGGFLYYDLIGAMISMAAAPLFVFAVSGEFKKGTVKAPYLYLARAVIGFFAVYSARDFDVYGISLSVFIAAFATLYVSRKKGIPFAVCGGALLGVAHEPILAPAFVVMAVASGALWRVSSIFASVAAFLLSLAYTLYISGIGSLFSFMPAALSACLLFAVIDRTFFARERQPSVVKAPAEVTGSVVSEDIDTTALDALVSTRLDATVARQKTLCETLLSMSEFFSELGERMKTPLLSDSKNICESAFDAACTSCRLRELCFEERLSDTTASINSLSAILHRNGKVCKRDVSASILSMCERMDDIIDQINHNYSLHERKLLLCDRTEIFATDYKAMHDLILSAIELDGSAFHYNESLSLEVSEAIKSSGLPVISSVVFGSRRLRVMLTCESEEAIKASRKELTALLEDVLGRTLVTERIDTTSKKRTLMVMTERKSLAAEVAFKTSSSIYEKEFCGDSSSVFESVDGMLYSLISDGMGSGREAALTSGICVMFMKRMLSSGAGCPSALKMLNAFLRNRGSGSLHECSATLDAMELDLVSKKASFYKSGAAPSFVVRDGRVYKLSSRTLPLGIIKELDTKRLSFDIAEGDIIIMVSDGVTSGREECPWLSLLIKENAGAMTTDRLCDLILKKAREENTDDDISVTLIKITKNN